MRNIFLTQFSYFPYKTSASTCSAMFIFDLIHLDAFTVCSCSSSQNVAMQIHKTPTSHSLRSSRNSGSCSTFDYPVTYSTFVLVGDAYSACVGTICIISFRNIFEYQPHQRPSPNFNLLVNLITYLIVGYC